MKTRFFHLIIWGFAMMYCMPICAQKYICLQSDLDAESASEPGKALKMYKYSTVSIVDTLVRVEQITDDALAKEENKNSGIKVGAFFKVKKFDSDNLNNIHFYDEAGKDRYDVSGITISIYYSTEINGKKYLIPHEKSFEVELTPDTVSNYDVFKYDSNNSCLIYEPDEGKKLPEGAKFIIDNNQIFTKSQIQNNRTIQVSPNASFRLILSSENSYHLDEVFTTKNLVENVTNYEDNDNKLQFDIIRIIAVLLLLAMSSMLYFFFFKKKYEEEENDDDVNNVHSSRNNNIEEKRGKSDKKEIEGESLSTVNPVDIENFTCQLNLIRKDILELADFKTEMRQLINKTISQKDDIIKSQKETITKNNLEITQDINKIKEKTLKIQELTKLLEDANKLEKGTLIVTNGKMFAQQASEILLACRKGEQIIKSFISTLSGKDQERMAYFLVTYIKEMPSNVRDQWNGVISTLSVKGYVNDNRVTKYLQNESNQIGWLKKHFVEDLLQSYLSPLLIMLEQIRCAKQFGISSPAPTNVDDIINEIIEKNRAFGVTVKYIRLYAPISIDDKERLIDDISSELPKEIDNIVSIKESVPLYISHIGITADGTKDDKTMCVVKN